MSSENVRKQCCICGTLHPLTHTGPCTSCFGDSWRLWCTVHQQVLEAAACSQCAREERRRKMVPARVPLTVRCGGRAWRLDAGPVVIGRDDDCDIRIDSDAVSRRHCELSPLGSRWRVRDLESTNGTLLDTTAITARGVLVTGNSLLRLGTGPILELSLEPPPAPPPAVPAWHTTTRAPSTGRDSMSARRVTRPPHDPVAVTALGFAVVALIASFTPFGFVAAIAGLTLGASACKRTCDAPFTYGGMGIAVLAMVLSGLALLLGIAIAVQGMERHL
ncbi:MAG TPA: FHA domain-containing protein [Phycisphaerae bacterium]|nr:FHA domain-containing protein [Phycisphaerae bacterium]HOI54328.1 FHA domain-containing protein [Phycisphaerae bacterium]